MAAAVLVTTKALAASALGGAGAAGVEAEPAEPEQAGAEHDHRQVVRLHRLLAEALAAAETIAATSAATPALMWTTRAAGEVERADARGAASRPVPQTQCATGS